MPESQFHLLRTRRFWPLFGTQFLGAFNDNLYKNALVILITYVAAEKAGVNAQILVTAAAGIFIFPFFLFSAAAGQLADKYDKARLIRIIKLAEIFLMAGAGIGFYLENVWWLMTVLFLMGTQSAFFGPIKYGILPDHLREDELIAGNGLIEAGTFVAILTGTLVGGLLILAQGGVAWVSALVLSVAAAGFAFSLVIPPARPAAPRLRIRYNLFTETWNILRYSAEHRQVFLSIMGISWFWLIGATFLSQFPTYAKTILGGNEQVVTLFLTLFSIGIGAGSLLCNRLLKGRIDASFVPLGALGMTVFMVDLFFASQSAFALPEQGLIGAGEFLSRFAAWRIVIDLFLISLCGGIYIVPLYAIMQTRSEASHRARTIASNNVMNALFMVVAALGTILMLTLGFSVTQVFLVVAVMNAFVALFICRLLPNALVLSLTRTLLRMIYRIEARGLEHVEKAPPSSIIVANHLSFLDAVLIAAWFPEPPAFAINPHIARRWWVRPFLKFADTFPLDPANPLTARTLIEQVRRGRRLVILLEGRLTVTGSLIKVYEGPGLIADKTRALILPVRLDGAQYTPFTRLRGKVRVRWFPRITITFLPPLRLDLPEEVTGRDRRRLAADRIYDLMTRMLFESGHYHQTLFQALLDAAAVHGIRHTIAEDQEFQPIRYFDLLARSFALGEVFAGRTRPGERVGLLLPNSLAALVSLFALLSRGRTPAMLNFSTGARNVGIACTTATIQTVYASRRFIEAAKLSAMIEAIEAAGVRVFYLEDLARTLPWHVKLRAALSACVPEWTYRRLNRTRDPEAPGVVLFTSGSEGTPKGVVLTHANILANRLQVGALLDFGPDDVMLNVLPMFHSFGLTVGTLLPILSGIRTFLYPTPLHYRHIPEVSRKINATLLPGTDTFLSGYARHAKASDFYSLRYVFAGAEQLKESTRRLWQEKFGKRILEGYGATETAPVLALNTPMHYKPGTVGRLVPGVVHRLEPVPGIEAGGRLWVSGPNVMAGYLRAEKPGLLQAPEEGWYDTGDIVHIDSRGFITLLGRAKRFAKIGGEMVSLAAVEQWIQELWPEAHHGVVAVPDPKKGEQLVLVTDRPDASREALVRFAQERGIGELLVPKTLRVVEAVPLLGTGKTDYLALQQLIAGQEGG